MPIKWMEAYEGIINISADAIISIDEKQRIVLFNKGAEEIFGWSAQEMLGQPLDPLIPERFRKGHPRHIEEFAASPIQARRMGERREIAAIRRNGEEFPAEASISKVSVDGQRIYTVVLRDVTERHRREEELRRLYEEAQRAVAARDDVLSFVSHDLGNPLAAIRVATAVVMKRIPADDPAYVHVAGIREALEQAQRLIRDLLDVQKAEAGRLILHLEKIDVQIVIDECVSHLQHVIDEKRISIQSQIPRGLPPIHGDPDRVAQIVMNLLGNAVKFSPEAGTIHIQAKQEGERVITAIRDEGPGIAPDELPYIFDRYWQAKKTGKVGHGLGLSIVQALTRAQGGEVWAESELAAGSAFFFSLPVHQ